MTFEQLVEDKTRPLAQKGASSTSYRPPIVPQIPSSCEKLLEAVPYGYESVDRLRFLAEEIEELSNEDRKVMRSLVEHFLKHMLDIGASDLDAGGFACEGYIWCRVDGKKQSYPELGRYHSDLSDLLFLNILSEKQRSVLLNDCSVDLSYKLIDEGNVQSWQRYRMTVYFEQDCLALNARCISTELRPLDTLGFHASIKAGLMFDHVRDGLTLVTGVTGSGKSSTLDAIIDANNKRVNGHIIIIGKPIEYIHSTKRCLVRHREVGRDVASFKEGVVQSLRQDPDIVVIGEMRDPSTISAALEVTDSGHKVFSTLHTSSAVDSIARIVGEYGPDEQERIRNRLADVLRCIVSQKLLPKVGGGRILAKEVLWVNPSVRAAIKNGNVDEVYQMMWEGGKQGMITLEQDLFRLYKKKLISDVSAFDNANNKKRLNQLFGRI